MPMQSKSKAEGYDLTPPTIGPTSLLGDVLSSDSDPEHEIACGFFKQLGGEPLVYTYGYEETKVVLEVDGTFTVSDQTGASYDVKKGDVLYFQKGDTITFKVSDGGYAYAWYTGQRKRL